MASRCCNVRPFAPGSGTRGIGAPMRGCACCLLSALEASTLGREPASAAVGFSGANMAPALGRPARVGPLRRQRMQRGQAGRVSGKPLCTAPAQGPCCVCAPSSPVKASGPRGRGMPASRCFVFQDARCAHYIISEYPMYEVRVLLSGWLVAGLHPYARTIRCACVRAEYYSKCVMPTSHGLHQALPH